jgi:hypothetical protein
MSKIHEHGPLTEEEEEEYDDALEAVKSGAST